ncbi:MAG TPA: serine/threonine-protein kinase [Polyangiaceae bacterium LLY-WYZ-15_(1-7)]|nr:hypothetical protein [Sandaracinus sp.]HJL06710.1 serine/threonine-protein kinase [Polyangiaceae bacterium LLY-WYZ-15_(1-7)]HJL13431.1 serine/threonine-protein kinase [Polyangiaceae bacterium LLY-WYZ-15_(1-7)]
MPRPSPRSGTIIEGRYRLLSRLGEGGMAVVWRAVHLDLQKEVALKLVHDTTDPVALERFRREAMLGARLRHRNVVHVLDTGTHRGRPYLVMELLEGVTLAERLTHALPSLGEALDITAQLLAGLAAAHREGLIHRDVKPENVILGARGRLRLVDFGLVKPALHPTRTAGGTVEMVVGTPHYMSPEQVRSSRHLDARTDVFSVGVLLYEMLVGETPFAAESPIEVMRRVDRGEYVSLEARRPDLAPALTDLVGRALASRRVDRFEDAAAMREALLEAIERFADDLEEARGEGTATSASLRQQLRHLRGDDRPPALVERAWNQWEEQASARTFSAARLAEETMERLGLRAAPPLPSHPPPPREAAPARTGRVAAAAVALLGLAGGAAWLAIPGEGEPAPPPPVAASEPAASEERAPEAPVLEEPAPEEPAPTRTAAEAPSEEVAAPSHVARGDEEPEDEAEAEEAELDSAAERRRPAPRRARRAPPTRSAPAEEAPAEEAPTEEPTAHPEFFGDPGF